MKLRHSIIVLAVLVAMVKGCAPASAQDRPYEPRDPYIDHRSDAHRAGDAADPCRYRHERKGLLVGFGFGGGGGKLAFERDGRVHDPDGEPGGLGSLRLGVAVSNSFAFSVEAHGYGRQANGSDWSAGAVLGSITWWPDASGFFLRLGVGRGGVDLFEPHADAAERILERSGPAVAMGLGYEWRVGRTFALGLAADFVGIDLDDTETYRELEFGHGGVSIQFGWYL